MKTTIYELLGMIKDDKAPKKLYFKNEIFEYDEKEKDYVHIDFTEYLFDVYLITDILNDEVEILDEKEDKKIEKLNISDIDYFTMNKKINEIIDKLNKEV